MAITSILMPVFNAAATLGAAVSGVRRQTIGDWQLVAVDDGSTDGSAAKLEAFAAADARITVVRATGNMGPAAARNLALAHATGDWIAYLDADDELHPDYLEQIARHADKAELLFFCYDYVSEDSSGIQPGVWDSTPHERDFFLGNLSVPLAVALATANWLAGLVQTGGSAVAFSATKHDATEEVVPEEILHGAGMIWHPLLCAASSGPVSSIAALAIA
jgi:glycosyltransferase involved in cell wall biosynthesis